MLIINFRGTTISEQGFLLKIVLRISVVKVFKVMQIHCTLYTCCFTVASAFYNTYCTFIIGFNRYNITCNLLLNNKLKLTYLEHCVWGQPELYRGGHLIEWTISKLTRLSYSREPTRCEVWQDLQLKKKKKSVRNTAFIEPSVTFETCRIGKSL